MNSGATCLTSFLEVVYLSNPFYNDEIFTVETQKDDSEKQQKDLTSSFSDYDLGASCLDKAWILHLPKCLTIKKGFTFT